jgi:hypothetical protein
MNSSSAYGKVVADPLEKSGTFLRKTFYYIFQTSGVFFLWGGLLFLVGTVLYYPLFVEYATMAAWMYFFGCICFLLGSVIDLVQCCVDLLLMYRQCVVVNIGHLFLLGTSLCNVIGSILFVIGGYFFLPAIYAEYPSAGCYLFISGCVIFLIAIFFHLAYVRESKNSRLKVWWYITAVLNSVGNILFITGSYYFLPKFVLVVDVSTATANIVYALDQYAAGAIAFTMAPLFQLYAIFLETPSAITP